MNKKTIITISVIVLVLLGLYLVFDLTLKAQEKKIDQERQVELSTMLRINTSYEECYNEELLKLRILPPAESEATGAKRIDNDGNIWIKQDNGMWKSSIDQYLFWGDVLIDKQINGSDYTPAEIDSCDYVYNTRYEKRELELRKIVDESIIESGLSKELTVKEVSAINRETGLYCDIKFNEDLDYVREEKFMENLAKKVAEKYPEEYGKNANVWNEVSVSFKNSGINTWEITQGTAEMRI